MLSQSGWVRCQTLLVVDLALRFQLLQDLLTKSRFLLMLGHELLNLLLLVSCLLLRWLEKALLLG